MKRVAGYVRVSRVAGRAGDSFHSPKAQAEAIRAHCKARRLRLVEIVEELDASGGTMERTKLKRLITDVHAGKVEGIVVARLDRFARTLIGGIQALEEIHEAGGFVQTVEGGIDTSTSGGAMGELQLNLLLTLAQWERAVRAEGFEAAKARAVGRGVHIAGTVPVGYLRNGRGKHLVADPERADAVRGAFALRATGAPLGEVARWLDAKLPGGPSGSGAWNRNTVSRLLTNRVYLGEARQGIHRTPGAHDALVDEDTFLICQALSHRDERAPSARATRSLLAGIVRCGCCGYALDRNKVGGRYMVYRCRGRSASGVCEEPTSIMADTLDAYVAEQALGRLDAYRAQPVESDQVLEEVRSRLVAMAAKRAPFEDPEYVAVLGVQAARRALQKVDEEIRALEDELARLAAETVRPDLPDAVTARAQWPDLTLAERRSILGAMIEGVLVSRGATRRAPVEDRVRIIWRGEVYPLARPSRGRSRHNEEVQAGVAAA